MARAGQTSPGIGPAISTGLVAAIGTGEALSAGATFVRGAALRRDSTAAVGVRCSAASRSAAAIKSATTRTFWRDEPAGQVDQVDRQRLKLILAEHGDHESPLPRPLLPMTRSGVHNRVRIKACVSVTPAISTSRTSVGSSSRLDQRHVGSHIRESKPAGVTPIPAAVTGRKKPNTSAADERNAQGTQARCRPNSISAKAGPEHNSEGK